MLALAIDLAARVCLFLGLSAAALAPLERAATRDRARWWRRWRTQAPVAAALLAVNAVIASALTAAVAVRAPAVFDPRVAAADPWRLAGFLVAGELAAYGLHRAMHAVPWLWRFHRVHHAPDHLCWWDAWRQHPVDALAHVGVATALAVLLQVPLVAHAPVLLARKLHTSLLHADVRPRRSWLARVVATPSFHQRHHAAGERPGNYAGLLACLDLVFGTWRPASGPRPDRRPDAPRGAAMAASWRF